MLAATSVLGDLREKCPPAEACRDAFERMSKATVQMCLSTTGFGSAIRQYEPQPSSTHPRPSVSSSSTEAGSYQGMPDTRHSSSQMEPPRRRALPKFDMNLRDLFPEETGSPPSTQPYSHPSNMTAFPNHPAPPPPMPRMKQEQQSPIQSQPPYINSQINAGLGMAPSPTMANPNSTLSSQNQYSNPSPYYNTSLYGSDFMQMPGMDFLDDGNMVGNGMSGGLDLGFGMGGGMGAETDHDWSEGNGFDLFDGFFFGGSTVQ